MGLALSNLVAMGVSSDMMASESLTNTSGLKVRFLGTGAADWNGKNEIGEQRRFSSVLLEDHILIDFTPGDKEMLPDKHTPDVIFYTHSHPDHYNPQAAVELGVKQIYVGYTWYDFAKSELMAVAKKLNKEMPVLTPIYVGLPVKTGNLTFTPLPANHPTEKEFEQTLIYLVEKDDVRLLYATDTAGIPARAARLAGIDAHLQGKPITAFIMEATMGIEYETDYRLFAHSSVADVNRIVKVLQKTKKYNPCKGQPVYLTHLARTLHGSQKELDEQLPEPLKAAYDGLEVIFNSPYKTSNN